MTLIQPQMFMNSICPTELTSSVKYDDWSHTKDMVDHRPCLYVIYQRVNSHNPANPVTTSSTYGGKYKCTDKLIAYGDQTASAFRAHMYVLSVDDIDICKISQLISALVVQIHL